MSEKNPPSEAKQEAIVAVKAKVGERFPLTTVCFVTLPDGSVTSALNDFVFTHAGEYVVDGQPVTVSE